MHVSIIFKSNIKVMYAIIRGKCNKFQCGRTSYYSHNVERIIEKNFQNSMKILSLQNYHRRVCQKFRVSDYVCVHITQTGVHARYGEIQNLKFLQVYLQACAVMQHYYVFLKYVTQIYLPLHNVNQNAKSMCL